MFFNLNPPTTTLRELKKNKYFIHEFIKVISNYSNENLSFFYNTPIIDILKMHNIQRIPLVEFQDLFSFCLQNNINQISGNFLLKDTFLYFICNYKDQEESFPLVVKSTQAKIKIHDLNKTLLDVNNSNFTDLWIDNYENSIKNAIANTLFSRHFIRTKESALKELLKFRWISKNQLRKFVPEVIEHFGIEEINYTHKEKHYKRIVPKKVIIYNSSDKIILANQHWKEYFPKEYINNNLFIQGGNSGIVFSEKGNYKTAFVEVFPSFLKDKDKTFSSFIRGEGSNIEEAEINAFKKLQDAYSCQNHDWDRKNRDDGAAFCKKCKVFNSKALDPLTVCSVCNKPTKDFLINKNYYCLDHYLSFNSGQIKKDIDQGFLSSLTSYKEYKKRTNKQFQYELKNINYIPSRKKIKKLYKETYQRMKDKKNPLYYSKLNNTYPKIQHFILKKLIKYHIVDKTKALDYKTDDYRLVKKITFEYLSQYSILENNHNNSKDFIQKLYQKNII